MLLTEPIHGVGAGGSQRFDEHSLFLPIVGKRMMQEVARGQPNGLAAFDNGADNVGGQEGIADCLAHAVRWDGVFGGNLLIGFACFDSVEPGEGVGDIAQECAVDGFVGLPRTSLVSTPRRRKRNGAWMRSASSRMRSGPIERQAANALRSRRIDTEPGLISTRRMRRSRGAAEALSSLLPEHSPSKKRPTEASSCIVGVWINEAEKVVASTCCRMRCTTVCSSIGAGSRQPERSFWPTVLDEAPGDVVAEPLPVFLFGVARRQPVPGLGDRALFADLIRLGARLVSLHLMEAEGRWSPLLLHSTRCLSPICSGRLLDFAPAYTSTPE